MERLFKVELYAQAYYSGAEYNETRFTNDPKVLQYHRAEVGVGELDGKHSDVSGDVSVEEVTGQVLCMPDSNDGECLWYSMTEDWEVEVIVPDFDKRKHTIYCTDEQWDKIQLVLGGEL